MFTFDGFAQNFSKEEQHQIDSLNAIILNKNSSDTSLAATYIELSQILYIANPDTLIPLSLKAQQIVEKGLKNKPTAIIKKSLLISLAGALSNIGYMHNIKGNAIQALECHNKSLKIEKELNNKEGIATSLNNIGFIYFNQGDIPKALEYFHKGLKIQEEIGDKLGIAISFNNIGFIYTKQKVFNKALGYFYKGLKIQEEVNAKEDAATTLNNIGLTYSSQGNISKALEYYQKSLKIQEEIGAKEGIATATNNIGYIYHDQGDFSKSLECFNRSVRIQEEIGDKDGIAFSFHNIAQLEFKQNNLNNAKIYATKSLSIAREIGYPESIKNAAELLSQVYKKQGKGLEALEMYQLFVQMKDSINNETTQKASAQQQAKYEYEKQKTIDDVENEKLVAIEKEAKAKQKVITYAIAGGLGLVAIFLIFAVNRLQVTKKQKHIIEQQKEIVEEKHKEITDSINYAERIQRSFLATTEMLDQHLKDYFVFFRPKDVVSGDFYWAGELNNGNFAFTCADSTGHGVPGAIMSILNISSLEKSIEKETAPDQILNKTRKIIIERLKKDGSSEGGKDGMDCSLLVFNQDRTQLSFAAANNPVFILRFIVIANHEERSGKQSANNEQIALLPTVVRNDGKYELFEFKPDKMPVGKHDNDTESFTLHTTLLQKGDVIYTLTDGFPDQFGGDKDKKYMIKNLKELLLQIAHLPVQEQEQKLAEEFDKWKGANEQVDDVCIIGVRI